MKISQEMLAKAEAIAEGAVQRMMDAIPADERTDAMGILLSTVTSSIFVSQSLARDSDVSPSDWQEHFLSVVATAVMQFNYDTLCHLDKQSIAAGTLQAGMRFTEYLGEAIGKMMTKAPDAPARPLNS